MIDLHTHTLLSDGDLIPSELVRRCHIAGYRALAITDHVDWSNINHVLVSTVKCVESLTSCWGIRVIPGVEITHVPLQEIGTLIKYARQNGATLVVVHGETIAEPVLPGTNRTAIECGADILAHPGLITIDDARLAAERGVYLELTVRKGHCLTNGHVARVAKAAGARLLLNTDAHSPGDITSLEIAKKVARGAGVDGVDMETLFLNSEEVIKRVSRGA
jgi:histidinol phosphatase-like PHP family hydrolase